MWICAPHQKENNGIKGEEHMSRHQSTDAVRLQIAEATGLGERALQAIGYDAEQAQVICAHLVDAASCGYTFAGLPRILEIAEDKRLALPRRPVKIMHETPVSALIDGGNNIGYYAVYRGTLTAIAKAQQSGIALVGVYDSALSGRNAYYMELIARAGLVGLQFSSAWPVVAPEGGKRPMLGTNPLSAAFPTDQEPMVIDLGTAAIMRGELALRNRLGEALPDGTAIDQAGRPTRDPQAALAGSILAFGGPDRHKGYALSLMVQTFGIVAGAAIPHGRARDYAHLLVAFKPDLLVPEAEFRRHVSRLIAEIKATPTRDGVEAVRVPSERSFGLREQARRDGILVDRKVVDALIAMAAGGKPH
jgi:LDH2 family malate/lactate/ureidoglycolate dehydrogenase